MLHALFTHVGLGAEVAIHNPYIPQYQGDLRKTVLVGDAVVLMVAHDAYREIDPSELRMQIARAILIDGRHVFSAEEAGATGWEYRGVGVGEEQLV